ncbi:MAG: Hsp20/alpha crystallin family protein [Planctomycetota bacterium]|nr:Hsp20/alpha crystallin family protein [Planctomycetota bacterium]
MDDKKRAEEFSEGKRRLDEIGSRLGNLFGTSNNAPTNGGLFSGLGNLIEQFGKFAEQVEEAGGTMSKTGSFESGSGKGAKGVYGFTVKTGLGGDKGVKVEPFGNMKKDDHGKFVEVQQIREPLVDIFDEADHLLVVAEVPGVMQSDVHVDLKDDILTLSAEHGETKYYKELLLPESFQSEKMSFICRNGIIEIRLMK